MSQPGYPLPSGELGDDEIVCQLVYLPNRPEYWQAFVSSLHYLATWRAWERDDDKRGKDAAADWRVANELTMECWRMACLEQLQSDVAAILLLMQQTDPCCGENTTYGPSDDFDTDINPGVGDPPTHYGETEVADWDEWYEYLCHNAHLWVDQLVSSSVLAANGLEAGGFSVAFFAAILVGLSFFGVGGLLAIGLLMLGLAGVLTGITHSMLEDAAVDIEAAREDIVCAIILGTSLSDAVEEAVGGGSVWTYFYSLVDYASAVAILYEGGDGETYLEAVKRDDCVCYGPPFDGDIYAISLVGTGYIDGTLRRLLLRSDDPNDTWWKGGGSIRIDPFTAPFEWAVGDEDAEAGLPPGVDWTTYSIANFTPVNNVIALRAQKLQSHSYGVGCSISMVKAWVSEDGGVTGTWHSCQLTLVSKEEWWSIDEENDTVAFSAPAGGGTWNKNIYFSVLMNAAPL